MSAPLCEHEAAVAAALRRDEWTGDLRAHVAACPVCSETVFVAGALLDDARQLAGRVELPDPRRIWLDAQLRARRLEAVRALRPIVVVQRVALACAVAVAMICGSALGPDLGRWLGWLRPPSLDIASGLAFAQGVVLLAACGGFLVIAAYAVVTAWRQP